MKNSFEWQSLLVPTYILCSFLVKTRKICSVRSVVCIEDLQHCTARRCQHSKLTTSNCCPRTTLLSVRCPPLSLV